VRAARTIGALPLAVALAAAACLCASCADPNPKPGGDCGILASWPETDDSGSRAVVVYRMTSTGPVAADRWGLTIVVKSDRRSYWSSVAEELRLPAGTSTTGTIIVGFAEAEERYVDGSAAVESFWLE
jgi:hypothetical protein